MISNDGPDTREWPVIGTALRTSYRVSDEIVDMRRQRYQAPAARLPAQPQDVLIDVDRTAVIIIDMQNDFCHAEGWTGAMGVDNANLRALIDPINMVTAAARKRSVPVLWVSWGLRPDRLNVPSNVMHPFNPNGAGPGLGGTRVGPAGEYQVLTAGGWGARLIDGLVVDPGDIQVDKHRISGFWDTPLDSILRNLDVSTLIFTGVNADHCVLGTLMDASFKGYDTIMVDDAVGTTSPDHCLQATLTNVRFCFGFTVTSNDVAAGLASQ